MGSYWGSDGKLVDGRYELAGSNVQLPVDLQNHMIPNTNPIPIISTGDYPAGAIPFAQFLESVANTQVDLIIPAVAGKKNYITQVLFGPTSGTSGAAQWYVQHGASYLLLLSFQAGLAPGNNQNYSFNKPLVSNVNESMTAGVQAAGAGCKMMINVMGYTL